MANGQEETVKGKTLITCNASNGNGGVDFYRKIKCGTIVEVVERDESTTHGTKFIVPGYPDIVECWRNDLVQVSD